MGRSLLTVVAFAAGGAAVFWWVQRRPVHPDPPALIERVREVFRLESVEATLYKKLSFAPDPTPQDSTWQAVVQWAQFAVHPPHGRALVFAKVHLGYDLSALDPRALHITGDRVEIALPPIRAEVELLPGETEVLDSNLDARQTAELLELAKAAFAREALADPGLRAQVQHSAEASLQALLLPLGFRRVDFGTGLSL